MTEKKPKNSRYYRPDVDGLRAIAILAVLAYHAFPEFLRGGFAGVDVFFVISGYLISRIIISELNAGTFTFADFYSRRIRRIFPALVVVLLSVLTFGWLALLPAEFRQLGGHVLAGAGFAANIWLWAKVGYFDLLAELTPTLHLWSLGIEEQFYLVWPLLLIGFRRHMRQLLWLIIGIAVTSFALNVWATPRYPAAAFYLPLPRFWELMIGGILAYWHVNRVRPWKIIMRISAGRYYAAALSSFGIAMIAAGFFLIDENGRFPGWWALLPTLGTAMLIAAGPDTLINRRLLAGKAMVYIGLISYPLYLWHWPLLAYSRILHDGASGPTLERLFLVAISFLLATLTYEFIEKRIRYARRGRWAPAIVPLLATSIAAVAAVGMLAAVDRATARSADIPQLADVSDAFDDWTDYNGNGEFQGTSDRVVLFFGDSHMAQYMPRIQFLAKDGRDLTRTARYRISYGCAPVPNIGRLGRNCEDFVADGFTAALADDVEVVVIGASWLGLLSRDDLYRVDRGAGNAFYPDREDDQWIWDELEARVAALIGAGKKVAIILNAPVGEPFNPRAMVSRNGLDLNLDVSPPQARSQIDRMNEPANSRLSQIAERTGAEIVDPADTVCTAKLCPTTDSSGKPLYKDQSHFRASFVRQEFKALDKYVRSDPASRPGDIK